MVKSTSGRKTDNVFDLVAGDGGEVNPLIYVDEDIYKQELDNVFGRSWLFLAHEDQIPQKGDYVSSYMAEDPILVVRQADGSINAFLNQCRHRGMRICRTDAGKARAFTCPYHGWAYDISGRLVSVPLEKEAYLGKIDKAAWSPVRVPRIAVFRNLIFGCWDETAPSLEDYIGEAAWYMDIMFDRSGGGSELIGGIHKWTIACNWKLAAEQFASDMYHAPYTHLSAVLASVPEGAAPSEADWPKVGAQFRAPRFGHGSGFFTSERGWEFNVNTMGRTIVDYLSGKHSDAAVRHLGEMRGSKITGQHMTIFPNFSFLPGINAMRVWHPRGPGEMEVWSMILVDKDAPDEVKMAYRDRVTRMFGTSGIFEQDDAENWTEVQRVLKGRRAQQSPFNVLMGKGNQKEDKDMPGIISNMFSEEAARGFYEHWARMMDGQSWADLGKPMAPAGSSVKSGADQ
jgi:phenylpropionate dioxygenase-like ring-hydroxylating dioxygenase large terminal subunit